MDFVAIDKKWNEHWKKTNAHSFDKNDLDNKYYVLEMFSYPSGANLHIGHWYNFAPSDSFARFKKMQGKNVFQPMGYDSFGLPAENYAIKTGVHPKDSTEKNISIMQRQLYEMGAMFEQDIDLVTSRPEYYKWTQWLFLQLYKNGLAYKKKSPVNFCSSCGTVIANEQVVDGACDRCGTVVVRKEMTQWFFKITNYAEELLTFLDTLDWPEKTKAMQKNWIGKSIGGEIDFSLGTKTDKKITVFTTRADTLFGVTYVVLAPEHPLVDFVTTKEYKAAIDEYKEKTARLNDIDRLSSVKEKTGQFTGGYCIHPITHEELPIYIADYCLVTYGTGAVMAVPAHDERDFDFAKKYNLPINRVIKGGELPFTEYGELENSGGYDGLNSKEAIDIILNTLSRIKRGTAKINYRLRDWSVSRQRYWGAPIPIIYCPKCGTVPVPEKDLPVTLPYNINFTPDGSSPLKRSDEFMNVKCPLCNANAQRDSDTLDTFVCSSFYQLRYVDSKNDKVVFDKEVVNKMLPVDKYIGGAEHACMHLLYARFITKALRDLGYLSFDEPFKSLVHQGMILGADGQKMSKSKGNTINPDSYISEFGSDVFRFYLMFGFCFTEGGAWSDDGIKAIVRFLERVERLVSKVALIKNNTLSSERNADDKDLEYALNYAIKNVTTDFDAFSFNTAAARIMELVNALYKYDAINSKNEQLFKSVTIDLVKLLAPFTPHLCEEFFEMLGFKTSVFSERYPECDETKLIKDEIEIAVQINSKVKAKILIPSSASDDEITKIALNDEKVQEALNGQKIKKSIVIKSRLINFVV